MKKSTSNGDQQGLRTPPSRWVSSQLLYVWVGAWRRSRRCSQNRRRPFLRAVRLFTLRHQLHYVEQFFPYQEFNNQSNLYNLTVRRKGLQRFWLCPHDCYHAVTLTYAETHLGGGVMSPFVSPMSTIIRAHNPTVIGSVALCKGPQRFSPHRSDRCRALMLTFQNSPLWQRSEHYNVMSSFWQPWLDQLNSMVIMWHVR